MKKIVNYRSLGRCYFPGCTTDPTKEVWWEGRDDGPFTKSYQWESVHIRVCEQHFMEIMKEEEREF